MKTEDYLHISPKMIRWACQQAALEVGEVAPKITKRIDFFQEGKLTVTQLQNLSNITGIAFGFFFLDNPPEESELSIPDLRRVQDKQPLSKNFFDTFNDVIFKRDWYESYIQSVGHSPLEFLGKFKNNKNATREIAADICQVLNLTREEMKATTSPEDLYSLIAMKSEGIGILVFKNGVVGNNTHRKLSIQEFRGFVTITPKSACIFINGSDTPAAWAFTICHELAHIWIGSEGVTGVHTNTDNKDEIACNAIAAELLVPAELFKARWSDLGAAAATEKIFLLRSEFKVSSVVIARRALTLKYINEAQYWQIHQSAIDNSRSKSSGGDFYASLAVRNGKRFTRLVSSLAYAGEIGLRHASQLLNTNPSNVITFREKSLAVSN